MEAYAPERSLSTQNWDYLFENQKAGEGQLNLEKKSMVEDGYEYIQEEEVHCHQKRLGCQPHPLLPSSLTGHSVLGLKDE